MPRKFAIWLFIMGCLLWVNTTSVMAQIATPIATGQPTCDLCGWCNKSINPSPADWVKCHDCLYDPATGREATNSYYTVLGCLSTKPEKFVQKGLQIIFSIAGGIAFLSVLYGSVMVLTSSGNPDKLNNGKEIITSSIIGILLIIFSVFLLKVVGFDILRIPGFGV